MLKIDFHVHTHYSECAIDSPKTIIKMAIKKKLDGLAIIDHNNFRGYLEAKKIKSNLILIPGIEISTKDGHLIALGITKKFPKKKSAQETISMIKDEGGLALIPHPFDYLRNCIGYNIKYLKPDLIEVYNGNNRTPLGNFLAKQFVQNRNIGITAGSDSHSARELGSTYTIVENGSVDDILSNIVNKKSQIYGKQVSLAVSMLRKIRSKLR